MKSNAVFIPFLAAALLAAPALGQVPDLRARAEQQRENAEAELTKNRRARLAERARLTERVQAAYARLAEARRAAERAETDLSAARQARAAAEPQRLQASRRMQRLSRLLGQAADLPPNAREGEPGAFLTEVDARLEARLKTLDHDTHIHVREATVLGRDGRSQTSRLVRIGQVAAIADGADPNLTGFVREDDAEPPIIVGPPLTEEQSRALSRVSAEARGRIPLDVDGALVRLDAEPPRTGAGLLKAGGVFVWPILAVGLLGLILLAERLFYFVLRPAAPRRIARVLEALRRDDPAAAAAVVTPARSDLDRILAVGVDTISAPRAAREQALERALLREEPALERGVALLGAVAGLAPLLGLLGTVTGMIATFDVISTFGTGNPRLLSQGISVALITTQLGLIVAVPALLAHAWVSRSAAKRGALLEEARTALLSLEEAADGRRD